jgi:hypothetical protein
MADIATVFTWSPAVTDPMELGELMGWHARAVERARAKAGVD